MATSDLPEEGPGLHVTAMDAAFRAAWNRIPAVNPTPTEVRAAVRAALVAAAPHIRADERARVLDEVQAALRGDGFARWKGNVGGGPGNVVSWVADYLRDTVGAAESHGEASGHPEPPSTLDDPPQPRSGDLSGPQ